MNVRLLLSPDAGDGAGTPAPTPEPKPAVTPENATAAVIAKNGGDPSKAVLELTRENYKLRDKNRELRGKVTPEGAVILTGDDAKAWQAYRDLGKPEDLKATRDERDTLKADGAKRAKADLHQQIAGDTFNVKVLSTLLDSNNVTVELREEKLGQKDIVTPYVKDGGKDVKLLDYAKKHWAEFLPSLIRQDAPKRGPFTPSPGSGGPSRPSTTPAPGERVRVHTRNPL